MARRYRSGHAADRGEWAPPVSFPRRSALLTDLYELTMAQAYWTGGRADVEAVFSVSFRRAPFGRPNLRERFTTFRRMLPEPFRKLHAN